MKQYWFVNKRYGYGWTPATAQGWAITALYVLGLVVPSYFVRHMNSNHMHVALNRYLVWVVFSTAIFLFICYKTGEKPRWRWGKDS